jgi:hypothetical protein
MQVVKIRRVQTYKRTIERTYERKDLPLYTVYGIRQKPYVIVIVIFVLSPTVPSFIIPSYRPISLPIALSVMSAEQPYSGCTVHSALHTYEL